MGRLVVKLKTLKYKEDFLCYLFFYLDLDLQAAYLQILSFRPYAFRIFDKTYLPKPWILDPF